MIHSFFPNYLQIIEKLFPLVLSISGWNIVLKGEQGETRLLEGSVEGEVKDNTTSLHFDTIWEVQDCN